MYKDILNDLASQPVLKVNDEPSLNSVSVLERDIPRTVVLECSGGNVDKIDNKNKDNQDRLKAKILQDIGFVIETPEQAEQLKNDIKNIFSSETESKELGNLRDALGATLESLRYLTISQLEYDLIQATESKKFLESKPLDSFYTQGQLDCRYSLMKDFKLDNLVSILMEKNESAPYDINSLDNISVIFENNKGQLSGFTAMRVDASRLHCYLTGMNRDFSENIKDNKDYNYIVAYSPDSRKSLWNESRKDIYFTINAPDVDKTVIRDELAHMFGIKDGVMPESKNISIAPESAVYVLKQLLASDIHDVFDNILKYALVDDKFIVQALNDKGFVEACLFKCPDVISSMLEINNKRINFFSNCYYLFDGSYLLSTSKCQEIELKHAVVKIIKNIVACSKGDNVRESTLAVCRLLDMIDYSSSDYDKLIKKVFSFQGQASNILNDEKILAIYPAILQKLERKCDQETSEMIKEVVDGLLTERVKPLPSSSLVDAHAVVTANVNNYPNGPSLKLN